jgi:outer membrane protein OmpA-like peptidoglycan-associated protein
MSLACFTSTAHAEDFSLHMLPGVEVPLTAPQESPLYNPGVSLNTELLFAIDHNWALGPMVEGAYLPRATNTNQNAGVLWQVGVTARLQGDRTSDSNVSPWIEGNVSYSRTGELNRPSMGLRVGLDMFTDEAHVASNGPFVGYNHTFEASTNDSSTVATLDSRDYNSFQVGWSFNFDFPVKTKTHYVAVRHTVKETTYVYVPTPSNPTPVSFTEKVYFNWDSAVIRNWEQADKIDALVQQMKDHPNMTVKIEGHASPDGNYQHNVVLATKRTASVVAYLTSHGVDASRLTSESFGPDHPVTVSKVQESHERSRRVEFTVVFTSNN